MANNSNTKKSYKFFFNILIALGSAVVMLLILSFGNFWPSVKLNPKNIPIGIVSLDKGTNKPKQINVGKSFIDKIGGSSPDTVKFTVYDSENSAMNAINNKDIYGYLVIPGNFTSSLLTHVSGTNQAPVIKTYINEGMNYSGVSATKNIFNTVTDKMESGIQTQVLNMVSQKKGVVPSTIVKNLQTPFTVQNTTVHSIGNGGSGAIPMMLSVLLWMGSLVSMLIIWRNARKIENKKNAVFIQLGSGVILSILFSLIDLFIIGKIMNLSIYNFGTLLGFTFITGLTFYLFQSAILNWIGMKGWLILIVIWLFGMPAVNIPVQFLNNFTRYAVYSWSPYRFSSEVFRDILYYNSQADFSKMAAVIITLGIVCLILLLLSMFKGAKKVDTSKDVDNSLEAS